MPETVSVRLHRCPACNKEWPCLAENPPRNSSHQYVRPVCLCAYPSELLCIKCLREEQRS